MRIAGIGCRPGTPPAAIATALNRAGGADLLAGIAERAPELQAAAQALSLPLRLVAVAGIATPTQSPRILDLFATGSVAEAAAIAAGGRLLGPRIACGPVTIAIAEVP
ncbi:cobalamin biosynthesis protein [Paracoccus sp. 1_MG-2023]|uniref:cobalamin biosynthesis protein n=1 Tax=unclassified Paracoccus (in: a-proteobacteria) TaxID=2688777 RepID=UPI001C09E89A|nr:MULTISPECIES: cobalamin biosynthesis protein [unclassified Paracoccus (in: a-proteobacteria)]MBU2956193.1 cobalamin biosynthesis protein [Paracoccus sp. C2R09]MDO6667870.1 cobalamin biosynthesis protein [Paracoccus sp. 1_MG-2023]